MPKSTAWWITAMEVTSSRGVSRSYEAVMPMQPRPMTPTSGPLPASVVVRTESRFLLGLSCGSAGVVCRGGACRRPRGPMWPEGASPRKDEQGGKQERAHQERIDDDAGAQDERELPERLQRHQGQHRKARRQGHGRDRDCARRSWQRDLD